MLIEGHCDERGTSEYNLALGERRARAAMADLVARGIDASRFTVISYGKERPLCSREDRGVLGEEPERSLPHQATLRAVALTRTPSPARAASGAGAGRR